ncbi:hypothetical protein V1478_005283 [Vespula squamosa]|uniref:Uncharacterized protein n=1 Tax=Vespula squamosa TaxID=30214 RepID=A0ABD2BDV9_VESSQ
MCLERIRVVYGIYPVHKTINQSKVVLSLYLPTVPTFILLWEQNDLTNSLRNLCPKHSKRFQRIVGFKTADMETCRFIQSCSPNSFLEDTRIREKDVLAFPEHCLMLRKVENGSIAFHFIVPTDEYRPLVNMCFTIMSKRKY